MREHITRPEDNRRPSVTIVEHRGGNGVVMGIIAIALVLAIGFFLLVSDKRQDAQTQAAIDAAQSVDRAAQKMGDAAAEAARKMRDSNES